MFVYRPAVLLSTSRAHGGIRVLPLLTAISFVVLYPDRSCRSELEPLDS